MASEEKSPAPPPAPHPTPLERPDPLKSELNSNDAFMGGGASPLLGALDLTDSEKLHLPETLTPVLSREQQRRLEDELEVLRAERVASRVTENEDEILHKTQSSTEREDFDLSGRHSATHPRQGGWRPPVEPATKVARFVKKLHESSVLVRYFTYIVPVVLILLVPLLLGAIVFKSASVGDVRLMWFMVWLEIVWLSLWAGRIISKMIPYPVGVIASGFTNSPKKWRDMSKMLEVPTTLFFWALAVYVSFLPTMRTHHVDGKHATRYWEKNANIVLLVILIGAILNLVEKVIIQLIAISFHTRTYADRIELNKFQIKSLAKLYEFARNKENYDKFDYNGVDSGRASGAITPKVLLGAAKHGAKRAFNDIRDVMGKIAGDFTGRKIDNSRSPSQVVLALLSTTEGSNVLARRIYRCFCTENAGNIRQCDLQEVFTIEEEAEAAFAMFDRDMNGDISCEEMELACVEIGRERRSIMASLKDLDSVVGKLDDCLLFIVSVAVVLIFLTLISKSTAGVLTSASSSVLALSWLFSATAQEFLASIIFVFVKHPFDVGDRVDVYQTNGDKDTFFVKEIALMYTEFRKLEGHIVQAPNSLLNTLFILNMRRSGALAEAVPIVVKFGTTIDQIEALRVRMLDFVKSEKREYQAKILTELRDIPAMHAVNLNVVFFYKSNWQNELVRLHRRNKFMCALMCNVSEVGIESPNMRWPGQKASAPVYISGPIESQFLGPPSDGGAPPGIGGGSLGGFINQGPLQQPSADATIGRNASIRSTTNHDFSLGIKEIMAMDDSADLFGSEEPRRAMKMPSAQLRRVLEEEEREHRLTRERSRQSSEGSSSGHRPLRKRGLSGVSTLGSRRTRIFGRRGQYDNEAILPTTERGGPARTMTSASYTTAPRPPSHGVHPQNPGEHETMHPQV